MVAGRAKNRINVRSDAQVIAVDAVIDQHIAGDVHVGPVMIANPEGGDGVGQRDVLKVGFGHALTVCGRIIDG